MRLFDFQCPACGRIERDVLVRSHSAVDVWCIDCPGPHEGERFGDFDVRMVRQLAVPNLNGETVARS